ncbi:MAG: hypothetical protein ACRD25_08340 [Terracidiphilus sp.]
MGRSATFGLEPNVHTSPSHWPDWFDADRRWQVTQRVIASAHFARSRLLAKFLLYIVSESLQDRKANITEHRIGVQVFGRDPGYSPVEDNIVRSYARQLRRRLAEYFSGEGAAEPLHIDIPLGGYIPSFLASPRTGADGESGPALRSAPGGSRMQASAVFPGSAASASAPGNSTPRTSAEWTSAAWTSAAWTSAVWSRRLWLLLSLAVYSAVLIGLAWFIARRPSAVRTAGSSPDPTRPLWTALFGGPANCYIVPADAGLNLLEDISQRPLPLAYYINGSYLRVPLPHLDQHSVDDLRSQQFTSFVDLQTVSALTRLPEFNPQRVIVRFPRDLQLDDLKSANAVILGAEGSDPWTTLAESKANFRIVSNRNMQSDTLVNTRPQPGEAASYVSHWNDPAHETFSVIEYLPNLSGSGHILLLQGLDVAGTQAAAETLLHPGVIAPFLSRAEHPDGSLRSFEILLRSTSIESNATDTQVIGSRIY